jgi:hypothetical protein
MNLFYQITFLAAKFVIVGMILMMLWALGMILHERYVRGNVDAFKPERRVGPADRRAHAAGR